MKQSTFECSAFIEVLFIPNVVNAFTKKTTYHSPVLGWTTPNLSCLDAFSEIHVVISFFPSVGQTAGASRHKIRTPLPYWPVHSPPSPSTWPTPAPTPWLYIAYFYALKMNLTTPSGLTPTLWSQPAVKEKMQ